MIKTKVILGMIWMVLFSFCAVCVAAAQENFSGTWIMDKGKTHDLPSGLKSYTMVVTQNEQQLVIETKLEGDLRLSEGGVPGGGGAPGVDRSDVPVHPIDAHRRVSAGNGLH